MKKQYIKIFMMIIIAVTSEKSFAQMFWNNAALFTGSSTSYANRGSSSSLDITGSFTLEAWVNPVNAISPAFQIILQKREGANANGYTLYLNNGKVAIRTNSTTRLAGKTILPNNYWSHISGTYSSATGLFTIYVNGSPDTSVTIAGAAPVASSDSLFIGKGFNSPFAGLMDEVRIWNRNLNSSEVSQYRRTSLGTNTGIYNGLVMSLTFQANDANGSAFSLTDWSGSNNNCINRGITAEDLSNRPLLTININECLELDGADDYAASADNSSVSPSDQLTLEAWIFPRSFDKDNVIFHKGSDDGTSVDYGLNLFNGSLQAVVNNKIVLTSDDAIPLNQWSHVCFVFDGVSGVLSFYLDGKLIDVGINDKGFIFNNSDSLYIGGTLALSDFDGYIDEARIKLTAKSQSEINQFLFQSIDESNDITGTEAVYNFDGYTVSNVGSSNRMYLRNNAGFAHSGASNDQPMSPLDRADALNFQDGFYLKTSDRRIPASGTSGLMLNDTLNVLLNETITDVNVFIAINHTVEQNLSITLTSPDGQSVVMCNSNYLVSNSDNMVTIFNDEADSSIINGRYVSFGTVIKPINNLNTAFAGDNSFGKWKLIVDDLTANDTGRLYGWGIQFNNRSSKPQLMASKAFIQGFYNSSTNLMVRDTMRFYLREIASPYSIVDSSKIFVNTDGAGLLTFNNVENGMQYYVHLMHRNSIETWSSAFIVFDPLTSQAAYDFTSSVSQAFGDNMIQVDNAPIRFAIYGGDVDQNGSVDATDLSVIDNDAYNFAVGYVNSDITGDNLVDASDAALADNNAANFVTSVLPVLFDSNGNAVLRDNKNSKAEVKIK